MQVTQTTQRFDLGHSKHLAVAAGLLASLAIGAATVTDQLPMFGASESRVVTAPQFTSDEVYALEAGLAASQVDGWQATAAQLTSDAAFAYEANLELARVTGGLAAARQLTSDEGWALEASQIAAAAAAQNLTSTQLTSDAAWTIEQAQLLAGSPEQRAGR